MANPYFNAQYYLTQNPDLIAAGINTVDAAWAHYVNYGAAEALNGVSSRSPAPWFDVQYYLSANPDLVTSGLTGAQLFEHFVKYGINEGRVPSATAANMTDASLLAYAKGNADLATAFGVAADATSLTDAQRDGLANHFYEYGYKEGRADAPFTPDSNPGQTFTLTTGTDFITGTVNNDTILAGVDGGTAGTGTTLNAGDQIDGGAGTDTLKIYDSGASTNATNFGAASIKNVEIVENHGALALNVSANADVKEVWQFGNTGALNVTASAAQEVGLSGAFVGAQTVTFMGVETSSNTATITVKDAGTAAAGVAIVVAPAAAGVATIENLTLQAEGKNVVASLTDATLQSLTITGTGSVAAAAGAATSVTTGGVAGLAKIDASANTGGVNLTIANADITAAAAGIVITGGSGNDSIAISTALTQKATVDLGAGNDSLSLTQGATVFAAGSTFNGGDGTDTLVLNTTTVINATNGKMFTGFENIKLTGASSYNAGHIASITSYELGAGSGTFTNLSSGTDILVSGNQAATALTLSAAAALPGSTVDLALNNAATTAAAGVKVGALTTNADVVNVTSNGLVTAGAGTHNELTIANAAGVRVVNISGDQALDFAIAGGGANTVGWINGSSATGNLVLNAANATGHGATPVVDITGGAGNDTITVAGTIANTVTGGKGHDAITLSAGVGSGADTVVYALGDASTDGANFGAGQIETITNSTAAWGAGDVIDFGSLTLNTVAHTEGATAGRASINNTGFATFNAADTTLAQQLSAVVAAVGGDAAGTSVVWMNGGNSYLFVSDGTAGLDANDAFIQLTGITSTATGLTFTAGDITAIA